MTQEGSPAVITHKEQLTQACVNITTKSVPSSLENEVENCNFAMLII